MMMMMVMVMVLVLVMMRMSLTETKGLTMVSEACKRVEIRRDKIQISGNFPEISASLLEVVLVLVLVPAC